MSRHTPGNSSFTSLQAGKRAARCFTLVLSLLLLTLFSLAAAQECTFEVEPNDTPATATLITGAGPDSALPPRDGRTPTACLAGEISGNDQDAFVWEISEEEANQHWVVDLEGIPGHLTRLDIISVAFADNGTDVTAANELYTMASPDGRSMTSSGFLMAPGRYIIGVSTSGGSGMYVAHLRPTQALTRYSREYSEGATQQGEFSITGAVTEAISVDWTLDNEDGGFIWRVLLETALGSQPELSLTGPSGEISKLRADKSGVVRFDNFGLPAGQYTLRVTGSTGAYRLAASRQGRPGAGVEVEPNNNFETATRFPLDSEMRGHVSDIDYFRIPVDADGAETAWSLDLEANGSLSVELRTAADERLLRRRGVSGTVENLVLPEGDYQLIIDGDRGTDYTMKLRPGLRPADGWEIEPNDTAANATVIGDDLQVRGELSAQDLDFFRLDLSGEAQLYRIQVVGSGVSELATYNGAAERQASVKGEKRLRLDNLVLLPGTHYLSVDGSEGEYALRVLPLGPAPEPVVDALQPDQPLIPAVAAPPEQSADDAVAQPQAAQLPPMPPPPAGSFELEPNDDTTRADLLQPGVTRVGSLSSLSDKDFYRFHLTNDQYVRIELTPPADSKPLPFRLDSRGWIQMPDEEPGTPTVMEGWLLAGDHILELRSAETPGSYYQLRLTQLNSALLPIDSEPNDTRETAGRIPAELQWSGRVGEHSGDHDVFMLPEFLTATTVKASISSPGGKVHAYFLDEGDYLPTEDDGNGIWAAELPAGQRSWLQIRGNDQYTVSLEFDGTPEPGQLLPPRRDSQLTVSLEAPVTELAAFWHEGQSLTSTARITNESDTAQTVQLHGAATNARVKLELPEAVQLKAGESIELPVQLGIPADLRDDQPLRISLSASSAAGSSSASTALASRCEADPVGSAPYWPVPEPLLGGIDVLWDSLGAAIHGESKYARRDATLLDGRTTPATGGYLDSEHSPTYRLAGSSPAVLTGALLHPQGDKEVASQLKRFRIETSLDGLAFTPVFEGELLAARVEQAFLFKQPVEARYARLVGLASQSGGSSYLGEFKLIAQDPAPFGALNLADLTLGGHIVWSDPLLPGRGEALLVADSKPIRMDFRDHEDLTFVLAFHNGRAAQIARLEWTDTKDAAGPEAFPTVNVEISTSGPLGPWLALPDWVLQRDSNGRAVLELPEPVWARYLRFTAPVPDGQRYLFAPQSLRVIEREADGAYRSALGEWGHASPAGIFEYLEATTSQAIRETATDNDTRETATPLASGEAIEGTVAIGEDVDWYRLVIKPGENHLELRLSGEPVIAYNYSLQDAAGLPVAFDLKQDGDTDTLSLFAEPGDYYLKLEEPKRTVVFSWDTSGSMGPYQMITYNALAGFAREVDGTREEVQLLAFDNPSPRWVMPLWSSNTERVQRAVNDFDRRADSSNSEAALLTATRAFANREGTRALLLVTDAETTGYDLTPQLWRAFEQVQPRIFTFEVSSTGSLYSQQLMQDWAAVNHGFYELTTSVGALDTGFSRASCILRRPKHYRLEVTSSSAALPGPGSLSVKRPAGTAQPAVEIIFDASGSMGVPLPNGEQRITVAKRVLEELVTEVLPEGSPFALRAFGHVKPTTCDTRLEVAFGPLDRAAALKAVRGIEPKLLSQTPLAESIAAVAEDLAQAGRSRTVILITDGEESCGGDPAEAVRALRALHPLDLAIVSLGVTDEERERFEALAEAVGASYVDAASFEQLQASVDAALHPAFEVLDSDGQLVTRGLVDGDAVELPMGVYTVRVQSAPVQEFRDIRVPGEQAVTVTTGQQ